MSKGSKQRPTDKKKFESNYIKIYSKEAAEFEEKLLAKMKLEAATMRDSDFYDEEFGRDDTEQ